MMSNILGKAIRYNINTASVDDVKNHLIKCDENFIPALSKKVDITAYVKKIRENAVTFEAWYDKELIGLIAAYCNDAESKKIFITSVSTYTEYSGKGIASSLIQLCIDHATKNKFTEILLEVNNKSLNAIKLYNKNNFVQIDIKDQTIIMKNKLK